MPERTLPPQAIDWSAMLETALTQPGKTAGHYAAFHSYSFMNTIHLIMQGCVGPVASFDRWKQLGRHVKKGAHAKEVIKPIIYTVEDPATGEKVEKLVGFRPIRSAFDYPDTAGKELVIPEPPEWNLERALGVLGISRVPFEHIDGNVQGYSKGKELAINPVAAHPLKTAIHEIGHILLGHTMPGQLEAYEHHRGIQEMQAEATALLALKEMGMLDEEQATYSRDYIQGWMQGEKPPDAAIRQMFGVTERLLRAGRIAPFAGHIALTEPGE